MEPKDTETKFKKGDYIVALNITTATSVAKENYIVKQREDRKYLSVEVDLSGSHSNGNRGLTFDKSKCLTKWRYANLYEIEQYDLAGEPVLSTYDQSTDQIMPVAKAAEPVPILFKMPRLT